MTSINVLQSGVNLNIGKYKIKIIRPWRNKIISEIKSFHEIEYLEQSVNLHINLNLSGKIIEGGLDGDIIIINMIYNTNLDRKMTINYTIYPKNIIIDEEFQEDTIEVYLNDLLDNFSDWYKRGLLSQ